MTNTRKTNDELEPARIEGTGNEPKTYTIPRRPGDDSPRAGFVGDHRPLAERLADPATPKDAV